MKVLRGECGTCKSSWPAPTPNVVCPYCGSDQVTTTEMPLPKWAGSGTSEVRVTDQVTGGQKGEKLERYDLIPVWPLHHLARLYGVGARKYEARNWEKGYRYSLSFAAMMRHAWAFWRGEDIDEETGAPHLICVVFHAFALIEFGIRGKGTDDRVPRVSSVTPAPI